MTTARGGAHDSEVSAANYAISDPDLLIPACLFVARPLVVKHACTGSLAACLATATSPTCIVLHVIVFFLHSDHLGGSI